MVKVVLIVDKPVFLYILIMKTTNSKMADAGKRYACMVTRSANKWY